MSHEEWEPMREYHAEQQQLRQLQYDKNLKVIKAICFKYNIYFNPHYQNMVKLRKDGKEINIYPKSNKYHDLLTNKRGSFRFIGTFLEEHFDLPNYIKSNN